MNSKDTHTILRCCVFFFLRKWSKSSLNFGIRMPIPEEMMHIGNDLELFVYCVVVWSLRQKIYEETKKNLLEITSQ